MAKDFLKKEPTKTEKVLYELFMRQEQFDRSLYTASAHAVALGIILGVEPKKIAEFLVNETEKIKEYGKAINEEIDKLEKAKHEKEHKDHKHESEPSQATPVS